MTRLLLLLALTVCAWGAQEPGPSQLARNLRAGKPQQVVVYGTSLCEQGAWVGQVQAAIDKAFPGRCTITNAAMSGKHSAWGVENLQDRVLARKPDTVLIEFAINDAFADYATTAAQAQKNLETMITRIHRDLPGCEIVLMTMNQPTGDHAAKRPAFAAYAAMYRQVAKAQNLRLVDLLPAWEKLLAKDPAQWKKMVPDGIHPSADGGTLITTPGVLQTLFGTKLRP